MAVNPALMSDDPELALRLLQRQRTQRITLAVVAVAGAVLAAAIAVTIAYSGEPGATAQNPPAQRAP